MEFTDVAQMLPGMAERVIVKTEEGSQLFAKRVRNQWIGADAWWWIDDQARPIKPRVVAWRRTVAGSETQA